MFLILFFFHSHICASSGKNEMKLRPEDTQMNIVLMTHEQSSHNHFQANMAPPPPPEALGITLTRGHWKRSAVRKLLFLLFSFCKALHHSSHCQKLIREEPLSKLPRVIIGGIRASIYSLFPYGHQSLVFVAFTHLAISQNVFYEMGKWERSLVFGVLFNA